jgi:hypothetical protein
MAQRAQDGLDTLYLRELNALHHTRQLKTESRLNKIGFCNGPLFVNPSSTCDILSPGLASVRGRRMVAT